MKQVTAYKCDYCRKLFNTQKGAERHEQECWKNHASTNCLNCKHIERDERLVSTGIYLLNAWCLIEGEEVVVLKNSSAGNHKSCAPLCKYFELFDGTNGHIKDGDEL